MEFERGAEQRTQDLTYVQKTKAKEMAKKGWEIESSEAVDDIWI